jgi:hypothetical protein
MIAQALPSTFSVASPSPAITHSHPGVTSGVIASIDPVPENVRLKTVGIFFTDLIASFLRFSLSHTYLPFPTCQREKLRLFFTFWDFCKTSFANRSQTAKVSEPFATLLPPFCHYFCHFFILIFLSFSLFSYSFYL